jgi:hypothetical protein
MQFEVFCPTQALIACLEGVVRSNRYIVDLFQGTLTSRVMDHVARLGWKKRVGVDT